MVFEWHPEEQLPRISKNPTSSPGCEALMMRWCHVLEIMGWCQVVEIETGVV